MARGCCVPPKKGGEEARGFTTVRGAPQNGDGRTCVRQAEPQEILCFAMRVSDLGSLFVFFEGFGWVREHSDLHQWQHRLFDKRNELNLDLVKFSQKHQTSFFLTENRALRGGHRHDSIEFFSHAFVDSEVAEVINR